MNQTHQTQRMYGHPESMLARLQPRRGKAREHNLPLPSRLLLLPDPKKGHLAFHFFWDGSSWTCKENKRRLTVTHQGTIDLIQLNREIDLGLWTS